MKAELPRLPRGRPRKGPERRQSQSSCGRTNGSTSCSSTATCSSTHHLTRPSERTLQRITRGLPHLRVLRQIMDQVYRLFDRRCRTDTALEKLAQLRRRVKRFKEVGKTLEKLYSPNLEKALTFLDDKLLPVDLQRGGTRQPPAPQDAEDRLPRANQDGAWSSAWHWTCCGKCTPPAAAGPTKPCIRPLARPVPRSTDQPPAGIVSVTLLKCLFFKGLVRIWYGPARPLWASLPGPSARSSRTGTRHFMPTADRSSIQAPAPGLRRLGSPPPLFGFVTVAFAVGRGSSGPSPRSGVKWAAAPTDGGGWSGKVPLPPAGLLT